LNELRNLKKKAEYYKQLVNEKGAGDATASEEESESDDQMDEI